MIGSMLKVTGVNLVDDHSLGESVKVRGLATVGTKGSPGEVLSSSASPARGSARLVSTGLLLAGTWAKASNLCCCPRENVELTVIPKMPNIPTLQTFPQIALIFPIAPTLILFTFNIILSRTPVANFATVVYH